MQMLTALGLRDQLPNYSKAIRVGLIGLKALKMKPDFWRKVLTR
jgi:hypothetical protein